MAVNAKLGVDLSSFEAGIKTGQSILKGLNAEMKATEAEFKATGNAEKQLSDKTKTLNSTLQIQKGIVDNAKNALKAMDDAGVQPTDAAYQKLYATMMNATAGMNETQAALNSLTSSEQQAAAGANELTNSVNSIGKKISLDQVRSGIDSITSGLENAAKKAIDLGEAIWNNVMDSARLADDILTQATMLDMTPERYQQYKGVFDTIGEITVTEWAAAKRKVQKAMNDPSQDQMDVLSLLGIGTQMTGKNGEVEKIERNWEEMFWEAATKLKSKVEAGEITQDMADTWGEALFGKKFSSLKSLINLGQEGFEQALETVNTASDEALEKDAALNDKVIELQNSFEALKMEVTSALAPALTEAANALNGLLGKVLEYLKTPEGKKMLEDLGTAVSGLFDDLGKIDPEQVVSGITGVLTTVTDAVQWLVDNKNDVFEALKWIVGGWAALSITGGILDIVKVVSGLADLAGISAAGASAGSAWASAFASAAMKAAPFLAFLYTLLNPAAGSDETGSNTLIDEKGKLTSEAEQYDFKINENGEAYLDIRARMEKIAQDVWDMYRTGTFGKEEMQDASLMLGANESAALYRKINEIVTSNPNWKSLEDVDVTEWLDTFEPVELPTELDVGTTAADITEQIGTVLIPGEVVVNERGYPHSFANGLPYVPYDGMLAQLHKGERVMTASENKHYTYNSNNYFGNVNLNNGLEIEALCDSIDRHNRRQRNGYGS